MSNHTRKSTDNGKQGSVTNIRSPKFGFILLLISTLELASLVDSVASFQQDAVQVRMIRRSWFKHDKQQRNCKSLTCGVGVPKLGYRHPSLAATDKSVENQVKGDKSTTSEEGSSLITLTLKGTCSFTSDPIFLTSKLDNQKFLEFLKVTKNRDLLLTAGGERNAQECVKDVTISPEIHNEWKQACTVVGAKPPPSLEIVNDASNPIASMLAVQTPAMSFPGLKISSISLIGTNLIEARSSSSGRPIYEAVGVGSPELSATGLKPVVWLFNKLTGSSTSEDDDDDDENYKKEMVANKKSTTTRSYSVISYDTASKDDEIVITSSAMVSVDITFPSFLLKLLPTNKEKAEESGGKSIVKSVEKDVHKAVKALAKAFKAYIDEP